MNRLGGCTVREICQFLMISYRYMSLKKSCYHNASVTKNSILPKAWGRAGNINSKHSYNRNKVYKKLLIDLDSISNQFKTRWNVFRVRISKKWTPLIQKYITARYHRKETTISSNHWTLKLKFIFKFQNCV